MGIGIGALVPSRSYPVVLLMVAILLWRPQGLYPVTNR